MDNLLIAFFVLCVQYVIAQNQTNNVCKTFNDYYIDRDHNPNCYYNPDIHLSVPEIVQRHGYPIQTYSVITSEGYILTIFRIPHGKGASKDLTRPPVFIQHGIGVSSTVFVNIGKKSLAFILADNGFDVWLGNFRGSEYSNKHQFLNNTDKRYWNFTFHENGIYDLPAQLDLVAKETKQKIFYIGYSMGTTSYFVYNSEYPAIAQQRLKVAINMAPVAFVQYITSPLKVFVPCWPLLQETVYNVTGGAINQRTSKRISEREKNCLPYPIQMNICQLTGFALYGFDRSQQDPETFPISTMQDTDSIGIKTVGHYVQLIQSGQFQQFDYGKDNEKVYGRSTPPEYNLSKINVPNYFIRANNDPLATKRNVEETYSALPKATKHFGIYLVKYSQFTHADFVIAKDVKELVYDHIVKFLKDNQNILL